MTMSQVMRLQAITMFGQIGLPLLPCHHKQPEAAGSPNFDFEVDGTFIVKAK